MRFIVAVDAKWGIGKRGDLLLSIPDDMRFFRETTRNLVLVMGYNTLLSFPNSKPLPGRLNIVLADVKDTVVSGAVVCGSMEQLLRLVCQFDTNDVMVIGGGMMYRQLLPYCDGAYVTKMRYDGDADTYIPNLDELGTWEIVSESAPKDDNGIAYSFAEYRNTAPQALDFQAVNSNMSGYFRSKPEIVFDFIDGGKDRERYRAELRALLRAYFWPLERGFRSSDVDRCFSTGTGSLERYLRHAHAIAAADDVDGLIRRYAAGERPAEIRLRKEELDLFEACLAQSASTEQIVETFGKK